MSNAACSVSVDKLFSHLELFYARVYGYLNSIIFLFLKNCNCFQIKIVS